MKILVITPTVYQIPLKAYGGTEQIAYHLACEYYKAGHIVSVVAPMGSELPGGIELIPTAQMESEETAFLKYKDRLREFDIIHDHSWQAFVYLESGHSDIPLPIIKTMHTDPSVWGTPPPVQHPCIVGLSRSHARSIMLRWGVSCQYVYNGIDLSLYKPPPAIPETLRHSRFLWLGRYSTEKNPLQAMQLAKHLRIPLDCYGDTQMVQSTEYVDRCRREADGVIVKWNPAVTREKTVEFYQKYRALLYLPNWEEPFGLIYVEAQACGLPVLTLDRGAMWEVVKHGETGYVCSDLKEVEEVIKQGCLRSIQSDRCVEWASHFSIKEMAENYLKLFQRVHEGHRW